MMPSRRIAHVCRLLWAAALICLVPVFAHGQARPACPSAPLTHLRLPHLAAALGNGEEAVIVALGSSSTQGAMASDAAHTYPAVLQITLSRAMPDSEIAVINRGIGGQDAPEELARMSADVLAVRPQLVIWQVGANAALENVNLGRFRERVTRGVEELKAAGIDVVLMDNQRSPRIDATAEGLLLDQVLGEVAKQTRVGMFSRAALMQTWQREGAPELQFVASDGLHNNDRGYACVARALARDIEAAVAQPPQVAAAR